jgi:dihydrofolate synthase / folylpolyglutamate synthase
VSKTTVGDVDHLPQSALQLAARLAAIDWLMGRINYERVSVIPYQERQLKLDRMRQLLTRLGQPDAGMKIIHVAGTKGKGSTSAMIAAMLAAAGYRAGVFSSPHLERIEERFSVDGEPCTAGELVALVDRMRPIVAAMDEEAAADGDPADGPTYFEVTTAMALVHFVERQVDAAVLEVGLGGRLDSTNVCLPAVSVITSISLDHTKQLGNTLAAIAREKAGIIKPGVPVVCGVTEAEPQAVIADIAREHGCRLIQLGEDFVFEYSPNGDRQGDKETRRQGDADACRSLSPSPPVSLSELLWTINFEYRVAGQELQLNASLAMPGAHQAANGAVALAAIAELRHQGWCLSADAMRAGLASARLAGRVEVVAGEPTVVLDTAHNAASARALVETLDSMPAATRRTILLSISSDKDAAAIVDELAPHFERFIVTQYQENPRAIPVENLSQIVRDALQSARSASTNVFVIRTPQEAWQHVIETSIPGERVCITGSFYLVAEMRKLVLAYAAPATVGR